MSLNSYHFRNSEKDTHSWNLELDDDDDIDNEDLFVLDVTLVVVALVATSET